MTQKDEKLKSSLDKITANIKNLRIQKGYSTLDIANTLGHSSLSYVNRIEQRKAGANYNLSHLLILADEFEIDICEFFR